MGKIIYNGKLLSSTIAEDISIEPIDGISSTNVQDTIIEVDSKIVPFDKSNAGKVVKDEQSLQA